MYGYFGPTYFINLALLNLTYKCALTKFPSPIMRTFAEPAIPGSTFYRIRFSKVSKYPGTFWSDRITKLVPNRTFSIRHVTLTVWIKHSRNKDLERIVKCHWDTKWYFRANSIEVWDCSIEFNGKSNIESQLSFYTCRSLESGRPHKPQVYQDPKIFQAKHFFLNI